MIDESALLEVVRSEFDLPARGMIAGGRGALGEVWRLRVDGRADLAVKLVTEEPSEPLVAKEVAHTSNLAEHGVKVALAVANRQGRFVSSAPGGWLRVSEWIDGVKPDAADPLTPARLGDVLGRMHTYAVPMSHELDGSELDSWFHRPPDMKTLGNLVAAAETSDPRWAGRLDALMSTVDEVARLRKAPESMVLCHRDLHPDNALLVPDGRFAVLDWDNIGPADPTQELASVLLHWFADRTGAQGPLIGAFVEAYRAAGGTGNLTGIDDFAMHIATRLNFLALQLEPPIGHWAVMEIEELLEYLPSVEVLVQCQESVARMA